MSAQRKALATSTSDEQGGGSRSRQGTEALEDRAAMAYWGDVKHKQASTLSHEGSPHPSEVQNKRKLDSDEPPRPTMNFDKSNARGEL